MRVVLVDDEYYALQGLKILLDEFPFLEIVGMFTNAKLALVQMEQLSPDLIFLDIEMPGMTGIEFFSAIMDLLNYVKIVFVTAYEQYAIKAFEMNALDYLVKPVSPERLKKTLIRMNITNNSTENQKEDKLILHCFGKLSIEINGIGINTGIRKKTEELLAYLIFYKGEFVSKEKIMDDLWPDSDKEKAANSLYVTFYNLKKITYDVCSFPIESYRGKMRICIDRIDCDIYQFENFVTKCRSIDINTLNEATEMAEKYNGILFEGNDYLWASLYQSKFDILYTDLLDKLIVYYSNECNIQKVKYYESLKNRV